MKTLGDLRVTDVIKVSTAHTMELLPLKVLVWVALPVLQLWGRPGLVLAFNERKSYRGGRAKKQDLMKLLASKMLMKTRLRVSCFVFTYATKGQETIRTTKYKERRKIYLNTCLPLARLSVLQSFSSAAEWGRVSERVSERVSKSVWNNVGAAGRFVSMSRDIGLLDVTKCY